MISTIEPTRSSKLLDIQKQLKMFLFEKRFFMYSFRKKNLLCGPNWLLKNPLYFYAVD